MGRIRKGIERATASRRDGGSRAPGQRRLLAFEKCEPRLALATTAGAIDADGGLINLDVADGDATFVLTGSNLTQSVVDFAYNSDTQVFANGQFFIRDAAIGNAWQLLSGGTVRGINLGAGADTPLVFSGPQYMGATGVPSGDSDVLRIDAPAILQGESEGGAIQLTAVLEPSGLLPVRSADATAIAGAEVAPESTPLSGAATAPTISPIETLRARAVVFRVAQSDATPATSDELLASLAAARTDFAAATSDRPELRSGAADGDSSSAGGAHARRDVPANELAWRALAENQAATGARTVSSSEPGEAPASLPAAAAAVDAALATWDDELAAPSAESNAGLAFTAVRERSVVAVAVAAAAGAVPIVRRFRRPSPTLPTLRVAPWKQPVV